MVKGSGVKNSLCLLDIRTTYRASSRRRPPAAVGGVKETPVPGEGGSAESDFGPGSTRGEKARHRLEGLENLGYGDIPR